MHWIFRPPPAHPASSPLPMASVQHLLQAAGWKDVEWLRWTCPARSPAKNCRPMSGSWARWVWRLRDLPEDRAAALRDKALAAFTPFIEGDRVAWMPPAG
jgi:hypothetical protein